MQYGVAEKRPSFQCTVTGEDIISDQIGHEKSPREKDDKIESSEKLWPTRLLEF